MGMQSMLQDTPKGLTEPVMAEMGYVPDVDWENPGFCVGKVGGKWLGQFSFQSFFALWHSCFVKNTKKGKRMYMKGNFNVRYSSNPGLSEKTQQSLSDLVMGGEL